METLSKTELKKVAKSALKSEYGFTVAKLSDIVLLEACGDGTYILFEVNGNKYRFNSHLDVDRDYNFTVWTGKGTIEKVERRGI